MRFHLLLSIIIPFVFFHSVAIAQVQILEVLTHGDGCPQGSVRVQLAPDGSTFSLLYDNLVLSTVPEALDRNILCFVAIQFSKPANLGILIESADVRGFVALEKGLVAEQNIVLRAIMNASSGDVFTQLVHQTFTGPIQQDYVISTSAPAEAKNVLSCTKGRLKSRLVIRTALRIRGPLRKAQGYFSVDSIDGKIKQTYRLQYQYCK